MRRHPPRLIELSHEDEIALRQLVHDGKTEQRVARRARVLLAMAQSQTVVQELAQQVALCLPAIWQLCRRYEERGRAAVWDAPRSGRPRQFSPLAAGAGGAVGLL